MQTVLLFPLGVSTAASDSSGILEPYFEKYDAEYSSLVQLPMLDMTAAGLESILNPNNGCYLRHAPAEDEGNLAEGG